MKKSISVLLVLSIVLSLMPIFNITANAASVTYYETSKDNVPLRRVYGSEYDIQSYISEKGTVIKHIESVKNWTTPFTYTNWHFVSVRPGVTNNGVSGDYWLWNGNVNKHKHTLEAGACISLGCDYAEPIEVIDNVALTMQVKVTTAPIRRAPYNDGGVIENLTKGKLVSVTNKVKNYKGSYWYKTANGYYIYSGNVEKASDKKVTNESNNVNNANKENSGSGSSGSGSSGSGSSGNTGSGSSGDKGFFIPLPEILCIFHQYSVGKCVNCGAEWKLVEKKLSGTYKAKTDGTVARDIPYKQGTVKKTYKKGDVVKVVAEAENSAKNIWYKTDDGYWVYGLEDVSLKSIYLSTTNYTFYDMSDTLTVQLTTKPSNAQVTKTWKSGNEKVATVNSSGKITPTGVGTTEITCTVTAQEGTVKTEKVKIKVDEEADYDKWDYSSNVFEYDLALECSTYAALAYPYYNYYTENNNTLVYATNQSPKTPDNLTRLLQERKFNYDISNNYHNKTKDNSPFVLAHKNVKYNGKKTPLVYVIIEGTAGLAGWQGNMMLTGDSYDETLMDHKTFELSADNIKTELEKYISTHFSKEMASNKLNKPIVVITGHSRGAAAGNLLARMLNRQSSSYSQIHAYLFATPNTTKDPKDYSNINNICNESDFVPYIPFSSDTQVSGDEWGYKKHGKIYSFDSAFLQTGDYGPHFNNYINSQYKRSTKYSRNKPDYSWWNYEPREMKTYIMGIWKNAEEYYKHASIVYPAKGDELDCNMEAYDYFLKGLAEAAGGGSQAMLLDHLHIFGGKDCVFKPISNFIAGGGANKGYLLSTSSFYDSHEMMTYHAAMLSRDYQSGNKASLFSTETYGNGIVKLNEDEYSSLQAFFSQSENELMLELAGWDINDSSTWSGIKWNMDGNIVAINLSYLNLSGWFNANSYPALQDLNIDGNNISMLAVSASENLLNLSCMSNNLSAIAVANCANLQNLDCGYNNLESLDVGGMAQLESLNCFGNSLTSLDLNGATALQSVRCGNNELSSVDISTNTSLNTFFCENNNIIEEYNQSLVNSVNSINLNGGSAVIGAQKYNENYDFNSAELQSLYDFASMSLNSEELGWNMDDPYTWQGVEWKILNGEYHITAIDFDGFELEGDLNLPRAEYVASVSCEGTSLSSLNLSGCANLNSLNCYDSGISELNIDDCEALETINCDENYLEVENVESSLNQIGLNKGIATYDSQNISADEENFNEQEREVLISFLSMGNNYEELEWDWNWPGTWDGISWVNAGGEYRVSKIKIPDKSVCGELDLSGFDYLEDFNFSGTDIEKVVLPACVTEIPESAFYNSGIEEIYMCDGVTKIEESAFAYCENLTTVVLPKTISKIFDKAFFGCENLENLIFMGNEPIEVGEEIAMETSPMFSVRYFSNAIWNNETELFNDYILVSIDEDYMVLIDNRLELKADDYYNETNNYGGDDVQVTVISRTAQGDTTCILTVYNEQGIADSTTSTVVEINSYMTNVLFEDINLQYVGEDYCTLRAFLWDDFSSLTPLALTAEKALLKNVEE